MCNPTEKTTGLLKYTLSISPDSLVPEPACITVVEPCLVGCLELLRAGDDRTNALTGQLGLHEGEGVAARPSTVVEHHTYRWRGNDADIMWLISCTKHINHPTVFLFTVCNHSDFFNNYLVSFSECAVKTTLQIFSHSQPIKLASLLSNDCNSSLSISTRKLSVVLKVGLVHSVVPETTFPTQRPMKSDYVYYLQ